MKQNCQVLLGGKGARDLPCQIVGRLKMDVKYFFMPDTDGIASATTL